MIVRLANKGEMLSVCTVFKAFEQCTGFVQVVPEIAAANYCSFMDRNIGGMLIAEDNGEIVGGLGYIITNDIHCGKKYAVETFWLMLPESRGGGLRLLEEFERVAELNGCDECAMIHLVDSFPDRLESLYTRRGYRMVEKHYIKRLKP